MNGERAGYGGTGIVVVMCIIVFIMCFVVWVNLTSQITETKTAIAVLQTQNAETNRAIVALTTRVTDLVNAINQRGKQEEPRRK